MPWIVVILFFLAPSRASEIKALTVSHFSDVVLIEEPGMMPPDSDNNTWAELVHTMNGAYANAVKHDTENPDSETDLLLENASIRLSSRMLFEVTDSSCRHNALVVSAADGPVKCALDDESIGLRGLADTISQAASRLQRLGTSTASRTDAVTLEITRIRSMEHLYRMTFALSQAYFDQAHSSVYFEAAREQLRLAHKHILLEQNLCVCDSKEFDVRLSELSGLDNRLSKMSNVAD